MREGSSSIHRIGFQWRSSTEKQAPTQGKAEKGVLLSKRLAYCLGNSRQDCWPWRAQSSLTSTALAKAVGKAPALLTGTGETTTQTNMACTVLHYQQPQFIFPFSPFPINIQLFPSFPALHYNICFTQVILKPFINMLLELHSNFQSEANTPIFTYKKQKNTQTKY